MTVRDTWVSKEDPEQKRVRTLFQTIPLVTYSHSRLLEQNSRHKYKAQALPTHFIERNCLPIWWHIHIQMALTFSRSVCATRSKVCTNSSTLLLAFTCNLRMLDNKVLSNLKLIVSWLSFPNAQFRKSMHLYLSVPCPERRPIRSNSVQSFIFQTFFLKQLAKYFPSVAADAHLITQLISFCQRKHRSLQFGLGDWRERAR